MAKKRNEAEEKIELELEPVDSETSEPEIQIEDAEEAPEVSLKAEPKEEPKSEPQLSTDDGIRELKLQLEEERIARQKAELAAREAAQKVSAANNEVTDTQLKLIETAIETTKNNEQILKNQFKKALAEQDLDAAAEIQMKMSQLAVEKSQLEQGKAAFEEKMKQPKVEPVQYQQDPVELLASQLSQRSAQWVRAHPEYARNPNLYQKMLAAHNLAMADGLQADTDDYFESIETTLRIPRAVQQQESVFSEAAAPTQRRSAPPAAPVSRSPATNSGSRPNVVRLTAQEREMAVMMGMTDQEYARNKMALIKEGKLN